MKTFGIALVGMGGMMVLLGGLYNWIASKATPEAKERMRLPLSEGLRYPEDMPKKLKPFGDWEKRAELFSLGSLVTTSKIGPWSWRLGLVFVGLGIAGIVLS